MIVALSTFKKPISKQWAVIFVFLLGGSCFGALFGWLIRAPSLRYFWFREGDAFLIERYSFSIGLSCSFLLGLMGSYLVARLSGLLFGFASVPAIRRATAALTVGASAPGLALVDDLPLLREHHFLWDVCMAPALGVLLLSFALWVYTTRWTIGLPALMLVAIIAALALTFVASVVLGLSNDSITVLQFTLEQSLLSALCGYWLVGGK